MRSCILMRLHPAADADRDGTDSVGCARGEDSPAGTGADGWDSGDRAECDEHGAEGAHHLGVLRDELVERLSGVEQPHGGVGHRRHR